MMASETANRFTEHFAVGERAEVERLLRLAVAAGFATLQGVRLWARHRRRFRVLVADAEATLLAAIEAATIKDPVGAAALLARLKPSPVRGRGRAR